MQPVKTITLLALALLLNLSHTYARNETEKLPAQSLLFIENKGQVTDQNGNLRPDIDAKLQTPGVTVFIGSGQMHYQWTKITELPKSEAPETTTNTIPGFERERKQPKPTETSIYRMDMILEGANINAPLQWKDADNYYETYYTSQTGENGAIAHTYRKLIYTDIYPGIDWVLYVQQNTVKYDFIVHPGADPKQIKMRYEGATNLELNNGALTATTPYGSITEDVPYSYNAESNEQVPSSFVLEGNTVSFSTKPSNNTIVIDPQLHWATYYGGSKEEYGTSVVTDDSGYAYLVGTTTSNNNIATTGSYQSTSNFNTTNRHGFIAKFNTLGVRTWATYFYNSTSTDLAGALYKNGLYIVGSTGGANSSSGTAGTHQTTHGGGSSDAIILKLTTAGQLDWLTYYGGTGEDQASTIVYGGNNDLYIGGRTSSLNAIATTGTYISSKSANAQSFISFLVKMKTSGTRIWGTYLADSVTFGIGGTIDADKWGNVYFGGYTKDTVLGTPGTHKIKANNTSRPDLDIFITKLDSAGKKIWSTYFGGLEDDVISDIACDTADNFYFTGLTTCYDSISTPNSFISGNPNGAPGNPYTGFLVKFDSSGNREWGTFIGQHKGEENPYSLFFSPAKGLFLAGTTKHGTAAPNMIPLPTSDGYLTSPQGGVDIFILLFNSSGNRIWGSFFGGPGFDRIGAYSSYQDGQGSINFSSDNNLYFCGVTSSISGITTANSHQPFVGGANQQSLISDAFLAKFTWDTLVTINEKVADTFCAGDRFSFSYRTTYPFKTNNTFTVQLSNSTGSFSSPVNIGSKTGTTTDTVFCTIPPNTPPGTKYRIRIIGNNIADTSLETTNEITINNLYPANLTASFNSSICPYDTLRLNAATSSTGVKFSWTGPSNFADTGAAPIVNTGSKYGAGQYIVFANLNGCVGKDTVDVTFKPMPYSGAFNATASTPCETDTLFLNMTNAATGTTFSWTGPNSFTSTDQNTYITSATSTLVGQYIVRADLNGCIQKDTATLSAIKPLPVKPVATTNAPFCSGTALQLSATTTTANVTYQWDGPNSFTSALQSPGISAASPVHNGDYSVAATLNGCTTRDTVTVTIYPIPAKPTISSNAPLCAADTLRLFGNSTSTGVNYSWTGPNSFAGSAGDTAFKAPGTNATGQYKLTVEKDGCSSFDTMTLIVKPLPQAVTVSNNGPVCDGNTLVLNCGTSTNGSTYSWSGVGNFTANTQNTSITNAAPSASGWYYATVTLNGCQYKDSTNATVNPIPVISGMTASNPLCLGQNLQLSANNISSATYSWAGPNGFTAHIRNPQRNNMQYSDTGWYKLTATANNCISTPDSVRVTLNPVPFVTIFGNKDTICPGEQAIFTALPNQSGAAPTYVWKVNTQTVASGNIYSTTSLNDGDIISCEMTEYTKCNGPYTDPSNDVTITVMPWLTPSVSISANPTGPLKPAEFVTFTANPQNAGSNPGFQWKRNGTDLVGAKGAIWSANTLNDNDSISVVLTSSYVCPQPATVHSNGIKVHILTGVDSKGNTTKLTLYPNPNNGRFILDGKLPDGLWQLTILNSIGQVVHKTEVQAGNGTIHTEISLPRVAAGTYLLRLQNEQGQYTARFGVE